MTLPAGVASRTPARAERLSVDGLAVTRRVRDDVDPLLPIVVLVHGAMDRAASFGRVMRRLSEFEVVAYDRRGYADSRDGGQPDEDAHAKDGGGILSTVGSIDAHGADLLRVIDHCRSNSPLDRTDHDPTVVTVGHSLGGLVALRAASRSSNSVAGDIRGGNGIVAIGAFESPAPWLDDSFDRVGGGAVEVARKQGNGAGAEFFYRLMIGDDTFERLRATDRETRRSEGDALVAELESLRDPSQAFDLGGITLPVSIGTGELSSAGMKHNADLLAVALPNSETLTIPGAGHGAHLTKPDGFARYVRACVGRSARRREGTSSDG